MGYKRLTNLRRQNVLGKCLKQITILDLLNYELNLFRSR